MKKEREEVIRILGITPERVDYLHEEHGMPFDEGPFTEWFIANAALVLAEKRAYLDSILFPGILRPELTETPA